MKKDQYDLQRFVDAQDQEYKSVCSELRNGIKQGHWMWYIFPQIRGLGSSSLSIKFAISSREEAQAYLKHPVLGERLRECTGLVLKTRSPSIKDIFGSPDDLKFRSSMTLFAKIARNNKIFVDAIERFYYGKFDPLTLKWLARSV
jgi:uncharacterized protein (DUF1810 family)